MLIIGIPFVSKAKDNASIASATLAPSIVKPAINASSSILNTMRTNAENRLQNAKINQEARKNLIDERKNIASTSHAMIKDIRAEARGEIRAASSTTARQIIRQEMRRDVFNIQRQKIAQQLELSIQNLKQIRARIDSRIKKEQQNGKDMSAAIKLLIIADTKIATATDTLNAFKAFSPKLIIIASSTPQVTSNVTQQVIHLDVARQMMTIVQKDIKDAKKSLTDIVVAIAHAIGQKLGNSVATSTPSTTEQ